LSLKLN
jgi:hypothetical protein